MALQDITNRLPTTSQIAALAGSYGTPSSANKFVTQSDPILSGIGSGGDSGISVYALAFNPRKPAAEDSSVYCGVFYTAGQPLNICWWEAWLRPRNATTGVGVGYAIVVDHSADHPIMFGFTAPSSGKMNVAGNMLKAGNQNNFGSIDSVDSGTWHHVGVGHRDGTVFVYLDGVLTDVKTITGGRNAPTGAQLYRMLYIGASNEHNGFHGAVKEVRGFEGKTFCAGDVFPQSFKPERGFPRTVETGEDVFVKADFLMDFSRKADLIQDLSDGYNGRRHDGQRAINREQVLDETILPQWIDAAFQKPAFQGNAETPTAGALLFDEFGQDNETRAWNSDQPNAAGQVETPRIKQSKSGNGVAARTWTGELSGGTIAEIGVIEGAAVSLSQAAYNSPNLAKAWADVGTANHAVTATQRGNAGLSVYVRHTDGGNFIRVDAIGSNCTVTRYVNGSPASPAQPGAIGNALWTDLTVSASGGNVTISCGGMTHTFADTLAGTKIGMGLGALQRVERIVAMPPA